MLNRSMCSRIFALCAFILWIYGCGLNSDGALFTSTTGAGGGSSSTGGGAGSTTSSSAGGSGGTTTSTGGQGGTGGTTTSSTGGQGGTGGTTTSSTGGQGGTGGATTGTGGQGGAGGATTGTGGGPADNVTFDTIAMACFKAVVIDDGTQKVVWGSGDSDVCPTELGSIYVPPTGHTMIVWVQDPANNLLSFNSAEAFTVTKARCSVYPTAPTWAQIENDYLQAFSSISNSAVPPAYLFLKSCANDAEYYIKP